MSKYSCFDVSIENGVAYVTMNRPDKLNTMVKVFWKELPEIVNDIDRNAEARVLVLQAEGKHFSAGMDFGNFSDDGQSKDKEPARLREFFYNEILELQDTFSSLEDCRMPTIAAIQGACIGGAIDMVSACDMRYCDEDAFFKIAEVDIGIAPDVGTLQRLPSLMPIAAVRELAYTGRKFDASEAKNLGLVNEVYSSKEDMLKQVMLKAEEIAKKSPLVTRVIKKQINYARDHSVKESLDYGAAWNSSLISRKDMKAALEAFFNKSEAEYDDIEKLRSFWEKDGLG